jgi:D-inositol-3-phosphate glycosyltransferase
MKILHISYHTSPYTKQLGNNDAGGLNVYIKNVIENLNDEDIQITVLTGENSELSEENNLKFSSYSLFQETASIDEKILLLPEFIELIMEFVKVNRIDLIHAHYWLSGLVAKEIKSKFGIPYIFTAHSYGKFIDVDSKRITSEYEILSKADLVTSSSKFEYNFLNQNYETPEQKLRIVFPGVDVDLFKPTPTNKENTLLVVGRIQPQKGQINTLKLFHNLLLLSPDLKLNFVGGPSGNDGKEYLKTIENEIEQTGLKNNVQFLNSATQEQLINEYNKAKIVVHASQYETFGLIALEANACGVPVVSINQGPLKETIENGQNGYIAESFEDENLILFCKNLLSDSEYQSKTQINCLNVAKQYDWKNTAKQLKEIYQELIFS